MKKLSYFLAMSAIVASMAMFGCKKDEEPAPTTDCSEKTFPSNTGTAIVNVLNYGSSIDVNAGDVLSIAVEVTKVNNRPQKLRIYETECANEVGTIVSIAGQPGAEDNGTRLDLRNTDEAQIKQILYTVPSGKSTIYLNIEINESGDGLTYKRLKLNVSGSGIIDTWTNVSLGGNSSNTDSRMSTGTGQTYSACNAAANIEYIDITYAVSKTPADAPTPGTCVSQTQNLSFLCDNPTRFTCPIGLATSTVACGEDGTLSTSGGNATKFKIFSGTYSTVTDADLSAIDMTTGTSSSIQITAIGNVFAFENSKGKKGVIKIVSGTLNNSNNDIVVDVKVQR